MILQCILFLLLTQPNKMADPEKAMEVENDHEDLEDEEVDADAKNNVSELLKNPALMEALQGKLNSMVGINSGYIAVFCLVILC